MEWISVKDRLPGIGERVLIVRDVTAWDSKRPRTIDLAHTGFFETETTIGGPVSLTGYHKMKGLYFSVPAILHPDSVTHWMPMPGLPE